MGDNAHRADLLSGLAHSTRTGLDHQTQREGIERPSGSAVAPGALMRLFVAIAPPPAVLDELDALVEPLRARRLDLRWTNREAWHGTLAFLGQVDQAAAARLGPPPPRAAARPARNRARYRADRGRAGHDDWLSFSRIGTAARSAARSSVLSSASRRASQASLRRRTRWTTARPSSVTVRITCRRSVGCGERSTRLRSSSTAMTRVIEGGCTFSCSASSPGVIAWCFSSADSAASWVSDRTAPVMPDAVRWARNRRASLLTELRRTVASPASVLIGVG